MDITLISCPNCGIRNRLRAGQDPRTLNCGQCDNPLVIEEAPERLLVICPECDTDWEVDAPGWVECPECGHWFEIDEYGEPVDVEDSQDLATEQASRLDDEESDWESEGFTSEGTTEEEQLIRLADYPALLEVANPDLYRCNAYNVLSILPSSDQSEIQRRIRQIEIRQKLGAAGEDTRIIQLKSQPTLEQIRGAKQRLEDPDRRFIDEFFWLWPNGLVCNGGNSHLPIIIRNLKQQTRRSEDDYVALHNLAVLSHAIALELERSDQLPDAVKVQLGDADSYWSDAFDSWARLLEDERFWRHVEDRVIEIDDPRLTVEKVGQLRAFLPVAIISINGQLTMQAIEGGLSQDLNRHVRLLRESGFRERVIVEGLRVAIDPVCRRINTLCEDAKKQASSNPRYADQTGKNLLSASTPLLEIIRILLPDDHPSSYNAHDMVALAVLDCQYAFAREIDCWGEIAKLVKRSLSVAVSKTVRSQVTEALEAANRHAEKGNYWCAEGYNSLPDPVFNLLQEAREKAKDEEYDQALEILAGVFNQDHLNADARILAIVNKSFAWCLGQRALDTYNAFDLGEPSSLEKRIQERAACPDSHFTTTLQAIQNGIERRSDVNIYCMSCDARIVGEYMRYMFDESPAVVCTSCSRKHEFERTQRRSRYRDVVVSSGEDLVLASEMDPNNRVNSKNLEKLQEIADEAGISLRKNPIFLRLRLGIVPLTELSELVKHSEKSIRQKAIKALAERGSPAIPYLLAAVRDRNKEVRAAVITALGQAGDERAIEVLITAAVDADSEVRSAASVALGRMNRQWFESESAKRAIPRIVVALVDVDPDIRKAAAYTLERIYPDWRNLVTIRKLAPEFIAKLESSNCQVRQAAIEVLGRMRTDACQIVPLLIRALDDSDFSVCKAAIDALGLFGAEAQDAVPALLRFLSSDYYTLRDAAAQALTRIRGFRETATSTYETRQARERASMDGVENNRDSLSTVESLLRQIDDLCRYAHKATQSEAESGLREARRLIEQASPLLSALDILLPSNDARRIEAHDQVALRTMSCANSYGNKTRNWTEAIEILRSSLRIAVGEAARERIRRNIESARNKGTSKEATASGAVSTGSVSYTNPDRSKSEPLGKSATNRQNFRSLTLGRRARPLLIGAVIIVVVLGIALVLLSDGGARSTHTLYSLGLMSKEEAISKLLLIINKPGEKGVKSATDALKGIDRDLRTTIYILTERLEASNMAERLSAIRTLAALGPDAKGAARELVKVASNDSVSYVRQEAIWALVGIGPDAKSVISDLLLIGLKDAFPYVRNEAIQACEKISPSDSHVITTLRSYVRGRDRSLKRNAAEALGLIGRGASAAIGDLKIAARDKDPEVRKAATDALSRIEGTTSSVYNESSVNSQLPADSASSLDPVADSNSDPSTASSTDSAHTPLAYPDNGFDRAYVITNTASLRVAPSATSQIVEEVGPEDTLVMISRSPVGPWYNVIHVETGKEGWIHGNNINISYTQQKKQTFTFRGERTGTYEDPEIEIHNDSNRSINLRVGNNLYSIGAHARKAITIPPGVYSYYVSAPNVIPATGEQSFQSGYMYSWRFWIETRVR